MVVDAGAPDSRLSVDVATPTRADARPVDAAEFARLFTAEAPRVWRALRRLGVPEADLDDLCQEVFVVVHRRWDDFRGDSSLRTWIYGIALRKALAHRRSKHVRTRTLLESGAEPTVAPNQSEQLARSQDRDALLHALDGLGEGKREVFVLYELEELTMREVAGVVQAPLHTCYARLYSARTQLAAALRRAGLGPARHGGPR